MRTVHLIIFTVFAGMRSTFDLEEASDLQTCSIGRKQMSTDSYVSRLESG